jgi:hypothetical protein
MLYHPADPALYLIECADLDADHPPAVVRDNAAILLRTVQWAREYLCKPHANLGRAGAVCPFVETSLTQGHFYLTVYSDPCVTAERAHAHASRYCDWFPTLEPCSGLSGQFKTILILFPQPDVAGVSRVVESAQALLKTSCVTRGLMIGEFHPGPPRQPGLWNSDFRPLLSPIPLLGLRHMVPSDFAFLENDGSLVLEYVKRFGKDVPLHLQEKVHQAVDRFGIHAKDQR